MALPTDNQSRKERPIARGVLDYFPDAVAEVAHVSFIGNRQHNPGEEMHWAREKSKDHADCIVRHLLERGTLDTDGMRHSAKIAWRALAMLQLEIEADAAKEPRYIDVLVERERQGPPSITFHGVPINQVTQLDPPREPEQRADRLLGPAEKVPSVYVAGPMRGLPDLNFSAFDAARDRFRRAGWCVISPADLSRAAGSVTDTGHHDYPHNRECAGTDARALLDLRAEDGDAIAMLPGWEKSTGAFAELAFARWLGLKVLDAETLKPLTHARMGDVTRSLAQFLDQQG